MKLFDKAQEAIFLRRPNRYLVIAKLNGQEVLVHCPNPGRLWELLVPHAHILITERINPGKTTHSLLAVYHKNEIIPLYAARANAVSQQVIFPILFPNAEKIKMEYSLSSSRFDACIEEKGLKHLVEVKSCTLHHKGYSMFPDAPSKRAQKHLHELRTLADSYVPHVVFCLFHSQSQQFMPHIHTDRDFCRLLYEAQAIIQIHAFSVKTLEDGTVSLINKNIPVVFPPESLILSPKGYVLFFFSTQDGAEVCWSPFTDKPEKLIAQKQRQQAKAGLPAAQSFPVYSLKPLDELLSHNLSKLGFTLPSQQTKHVWKHKDTHIFSDPNFHDFLLDLRHKDFL